MRMPLLGSVARLGGLVLLFLGSALLVPCFSRLSRRNTILVGQKPSLRVHAAGLLAAVPPVIWPLLLSAVAWAVILADIPPQRQDFPLHDDWAFARGAFAFFHGQGIHYSQWAAMPQLGQWLWSLPFLAVLGETHFSLRLSTIVLGWFALLALYDLLRQAQVAPGRAAFAVAVLASNPWFFLSQGTFMTDVPSLALALGALCLYGRALSRGSRGCLAAAVVVALLGAITRQNTIAAGLAAGAFLARDARLRLRPLWWLAVLLPLVVAGAVHLWFQSRPDIRPQELGWPSKFHALHTGWLIIHTLGLVAIPVLLLDLRSLSWKRFTAALVLLLLAAYYWRHNSEELVFGGLFPYTFGVLDLWGAFTNYITCGFRDVLLTPNLCLALSVAGCVGGAALLARRPGGSCAGGLLLLFSLVQALLLLALPVTCDRYLEVLFPAGVYLALSARPLRARGWLAAGAALAVSMGISIGLMHDWLAWNEARWAVGRRAVERGVQPQDVEGGFEWDGWFAPVPMLPPGSVPRGPLVLDYSADNFCHVRGRYALSFSVLSKTVPIDAEPYWFWLQPGQREVYLIRPDPAPPEAILPP
jgi:hypothetical protein